MRPITSRANLTGWNVSVLTGPFDFRDPLVIAWANERERQRIRQLSPENVEQELARVDRVRARRFIELMSEERLEALVADNPELAALRDSDLYALSRGDGLTVSKLSTAQNTFAPSRRTQNDQVAQIDHVRLHAKKT